MVLVLDAAGSRASRPAARFGRRAIVVAVLAAVLGGLSGLALGSWLAWREVDPQAPGKAAAVSVARTVLPGPFDDKVVHYGRSTFWNPYSRNTLHGGTGVRVGRTTVTGSVPQHTTSEQVAAAVAQQMRAQGWRDVRTTVHRYGPATSPPASFEVTGTQAGYLAAVQLDDASALSLTLMWAEPPGHLRATVAGGVAGALLGALLGLGTARRMRRFGRGRQRAYTMLCLATLLLLAPACLGNIPTSTGSLLANTHRNGAGPSVYWGGFVIYGAEPLAILSLVPILAIIVGCFWPRPEPAGPPDTSGAPQTPAAQGS